MNSTDDDHYKYFIASLKHHLEKKGLTHLAFATELGVSREYISLIVGSKRKPGRDTLFKIIFAMDFKGYEECINFGKKLLNADPGEVHSPPPTYNNKVVAINQRHHNLIDAFPEAQQEAAFELNEIARDFAENNPTFFEQLLAQARILRDAATARQDKGGRAGTKKTGSNDSD